MSLPIKRLNLKNGIYLITKFARLVLDSGEEIKTNFLTQMFSKLIAN
jgi:hypothetical protein